MQLSYSLKLLVRLLVRYLAPALILACLSIAALSAQSAGAALDQDHIVSPQAMQQQVVNAAASRQQNIETLTGMLKTPVAQKAMHDAKVDPLQVKNAIPTLSDEELANLSGRVTKAQSDFSAGVLGIGLLSLIIILVIVIIVVSAVH